jgi:hypothetical protein
MADYSSPSSTRSTSPNSKRKTNTLAITPLPRDFFAPTILDVLRQHFESYGEVAHWVPLSSFQRIIVVYRYPEDAERAKLASDPIILEHPHGLLVIFSPFISLSDSFFSTLQKTDNIARISCRSYTYRRS